MGSYVAIKGQVLSINLLDDLRDNGWVISGGKAIHSGCNAGFIELLNPYYTVGVPNEFKFRVSGYSSGSVYIMVGDEEGTEVMANGEYTDVLTPELNDKVYFWSDGNLAIEYLSIAPVNGQNTTATTFGFDEKNNKWVSFYSYEPEFMIKFINDFFTFKGGELWRHNVNEIRNNFYNEQFTSKIIFYAHLNPDEVKLFHSMRQKSNKVWGVPEIEVPAYYGKPNGQKSRLKKGVFKNMQGDWFADFLRDLSDPRFNTELEALMNGALLQGSVMKITIENKDTVEVRLASVDIIASKSDYTY